MASAGRFAIEAPATVLFRDFFARCREATRISHCKTLGRDPAPQELLGVRAFLRRQERIQEEYRALGELTARQLRQARPLLLREQWPSREELRDAAAVLKSCRERIQSGAPLYDKRADQYVAQEQQAVRFDLAAALVEQGARVPEQLLEGAVVTVETARQQSQAARSRAQRLEPGLIAFERDCVDRMAAGVSLLFSLEVPRLRALRAEVERTWKAASRLAPLQQRQVAALRKHLLYLELTAPATPEPAGDSEPRSLQGNQVRALLVELCAALRDLEWPFDHSSGSRTMADHLIPTLPEGASLADLMGVAQNACEELERTLVRCLCLANVARAVLEVESSLPGIRSDGVRGRLPRNAGGSRGP
jgi:hypothetical protein